MQIPAETVPLTMILIGLITTIGWSTWKASKRSPAPTPSSSPSPLTAVTILPPPLVLIPPPPPAARCSFRPRRGGAPPPESEATDAPAHAASVQTFEKPFPASFQFVHAHSNLSRAFVVKVWLLAQLGSQSEFLKKMADKMI